MYIFAIWVQNYKKIPNYYHLRQKNYTINAKDNTGRTDMVRPVYL